jgi:hypothetical protein
LTSEEGKPRLNPIIGDPFTAPTKVIPSGGLSDVKTKEKEGDENQDPTTKTLKKRGLDPKRLSTTWIYSKILRKEIKVSEERKKHVHVVNMVNAETGSTFTPEDHHLARDVLRTNGQVIYTLLSKKCSRENSLFHPDDEQFETFKKVLLQKKTSKSRQLVVTRLGEALVRVFTVYRTQFDPRFVYIEKDRDLVQEAGALCFLRGIDPTQLISYWAEEVQKFTKMEFPVLAFLCRHQNVEQAQACLPLSWEPGAKKKSTGKKKLPPTLKEGALPVNRDSMNAFGKAENLDPRVRPGLTEAGIDVSQYDDKYLATFQQNAKIHTFYPRFYIPSGTAHIVKWIAKNIYGKKET